MNVSLLTIHTIVLCGAVVGLVLTDMSVAQAAQRTEKISEKVQSNGGVALSWESRTGLQVHMEPPLLTATVDKSKQNISVNLTSHSTKDDKAIFDYDTSLTVNGRKIKGTYRVELLLPKSDMILYKAQFSFAHPVPLDISTKYVFHIHGQPARAVVLPERAGTVQTHEFKKAPAAFFDLGKAVVRTGTELAMPAIGLDFTTSSLAVSADPYTGTAFSTKSIKESKEEHTQLSLTTTYPGSTIPVLTEERTIALQFHRNGIDGTLRNFYRTIPDIKPGPAWIHDIHLTFYDYIAETGKSLEPDLDALAKRIPEEYSKHVLVCLHGYYDYLGRYSYNHKTGTFDAKWDAFDNKARHLPMTKEELRRRMRLVKSYGFRVGIYYADALAYDDLSPDFKKDWIWRDANGRPVRWYYWQRRPDKNNKRNRDVLDIEKEISTHSEGGKNKGKNYMLDPSNPEVQRWFIDYTAAYVKEFGRDIDALVWDETHCVAQGHVAKTAQGLVAADRAMMEMVADIAREVQRGWASNPDLALLLSDNINKHGQGHIPYCLVAHGTWQDSFCDPKAWAPGMIPNYRNCLYSCNWWPIRHRGWNRIAVEKFGLPQGLTNGFGDDRGPAEMPEDLLNETIALFLERCKSGRDRTRYLLPQLEPNKDLKATQ